MYKINKRQNPNALIIRFYELNIQSPQIPQKLSSINFYKINLSPLKITGMCYEIIKNGFLIKFQETILYKSIHKQDITFLPKNIGMICNHQQWLFYQILGGKTAKNIQIDLQTKEIWR